MATPKGFRYLFSGLLLGLLILVANLNAAQAQAIFQVSSSASTMTNIGQTELVGFVTFTVVSGTTQAGTLEFFIPNATLTNDASSGISLSGTGGLATATITTVVPGGGVIIIS